MRAASSRARRFRGGSVRQRFLSICNYELRKGISSVGKVVQQQRRENTLFA